MIAMPPELATTVMILISPDGKVMDPESMTALFAGVSKIIEALATVDSLPAASLVLMYAVFVPSPDDSVYDLVEANASHALQSTPSVLKRMFSTPEPPSLAAIVRVTEIEKAYVAPELIEKTVIVGARVSTLNCHTSLSFSPAVFIATTFQ